jgi:hypothetical protein
MNRTNGEHMREFDPYRIASEWHSGQGSVLYAYSSSGRIPTEDFKDRLVNEIERWMGRADDEQLDELEYLLMHVEETQPEHVSDMHEIADLDDANPGSWEDQVNAELSKQGLRLADSGAGESGWYVIVLVDDEPVKVWATDEPLDQLDEIQSEMCEECGGMKVEGVCECFMNEGEFGDWLIGSSVPHLKRRR